MSNPTEQLGDDHAIVLTTVLDRRRPALGPAKVEDVAAATAWPGERAFSRDVTRHLLQDLAAVDLAVRHRGGTGTWLEAADEDMVRPAGCAAPSARAPATWSRERR